MKTPEYLYPAVRQYRHNDGSDGFVFGFDHDETIKIIKSLLERHTTDTMRFRLKAFIQTLLRKASHSVKRCTKFDKQGD